MERIVASLANLLASRFGYQITVLTCYDRDGGAVYPLHPAVKVDCLHAPDYPKNPFKRISWYLGLRKPVADWLAREPVDVVMAKGSYLCTLLALISNRNVIRIGCEHISYRAVNFGQRVLRRMLYHRLDQVVVLTERDRAAFAPWLRQVTAIPNFMEHLPEVTSPLTGKIIISAGRLAHQKGYDLLLDAAPAVFRAYPDWRMIVYGEGPERVALEQKVNQLNLGPFVQFPGEVENVVPLLTEASVFVIPSRYEGFPVSLLEAISTGLPCTGFNCSGPDVLIQHEVNGLLAAPGDIAQLSANLVRLLGDARERSMFGEASLKIARNYEAPQVAEKWKALLEQLVTKRDSRS